MASGSFVRACRLLVQSLFLLCLCVSLVAAAPTSTDAPDYDSSSSSVGGNRPCRDPVVRKEWRTLSPAQRTQYIQAVKCVMRKGPILPKRIPSVTSRFEDYLASHITKMTQIHYVVSPVSPAQSSPLSTVPGSTLYTLLTARLGLLPPLAPLVHLALRARAADLRLEPRTAVLGLA